MKKMNKILMTAASFCFMFVMVVSLAGCGGSKKEYASVKEYLEAQQDQIDEAIKQLEGSGMTMEVKADGDTLVYRYTYETAIEVTDDITNYFETQLSTLETQFTPVLEEMEKLVDVKSPAVYLSYENPDGSIIFEHTFTK